MKTSIHLYTT